LWSTTTVPRGSLKASARRLRKFYNNAGREAGLASSSGPTGVSADELHDARVKSSWFRRGDVDGQLKAIYSMDSTGLIIV
jgi:hypothetical protein